MNKNQPCNKSSNQTHEGVKIFHIIIKAQDEPLKPYGSWHRVGQLSKKEQKESDGWLDFGRS